jgi:hypothetical protein
MGEDWLILDRVIDAPVYQVKTDLEIDSGQAIQGNVSNISLACQSQALYCVCDGGRMWITC